MNYLFVDGACKITEDNYVSLGWGYIITDEKFNIIEEKYGKPRKGTKNSIQCELESLYQGLKKVYNSYSNKPCIIYSDNKSIISAIQGFSRRSSNRKYWIGIEELFNKMIGNITINHVKSHQAGDDPIIDLNRKVDRLASIGANSLIVSPVEI